MMKTAHRRQEKTWNKRPKWKKKTLSAASVNTVAVSSHTIFHVHVLGFGENETYTRVRSFCWKHKKIGFSLCVCVGWRRSFSCPCRTMFILLILIRPFIPFVALHRSNGATRRADTLYSSRWNWKITNGVHYVRRWTRSLAWTHTPNETRSDKKQTNNKQQNNGSIRVRRDECFWCTLHADSHSIALAASEATILCNVYGVGRHTAMHDEWI